MAQEIARVARRLEEAKESKNLDLASCELTQIPDAVYLMLKNTDVEVCDLTGNKIKRIQSKFCNKLPTLTELMLSGNHLSTLPDEMSNMEHLKVLDISDNNYEVFPASLYACQKLTTITVRNNKITEIDVDRLRKMTSLREINLQDNPLTPNIESQLKSIDLFTVLTGISDPVGKELDELE